eukprot:TRINITY_DN3254_c1_g1_i1.p1 TRINITY_DN3254_c1_g1~~TRINITY_DN3254_c1_g1_i1.p1  ORF type:complete len:959 (+),score=272.50 TRINITY_DN3254_c1_g1_i1:56-2932(+)
MDEKVIWQLLQNSNSPDGATRRQAEQELNDHKTKPGFPSLVLRIVGTPQVSEEIKLIASVFLKNIAKNNWSPSADNIITAEDKAQIKQMIAGVLLDAPPAVKRTLSDAITKICECDFPKEWPHLVTELVTRASAAFTEKNVDLLSGILTTMHSIFVRYRQAFLTEALKEEILPIIASVGPCLLTVLSWLSTETQTHHPEKQLTLLTLTRICIDIYHDLTCLDLAPFMEDNIGGFMNIFLQLMKYDSAALHTKSAYEEGPLEQTKACITEMLTLFLSQFDEDFQPFLPAFAEIIWSSLTKITDVPKYDELAIASMDFLSATARSIHHTVFKEPATLSTVCEQIIIPNIRIRQSDVDMFDDESEDYIRRDIEGSDQHTRRRSACEFTHSLCKNYQSDVTAIFQGHVTTLLQSFATTQDWKAKDSAIYLITALSVKQATSNIALSGVRSTEMVNVGDFFNSHILPELQTEGNAAKPKFPVLKADAIKFVSSFRNQLPPEHLPPAISLLSEWLLCESEVVHTYAAATIERLLTMRNPDGTAQIQKPAMVQLTGPLFQNLFTALDKQLRENHYLMMCVMRVIRTSEEIVGPYIGPVLAPLSKILFQVTKNPSNPAYNHYLFESISGLVKHNPAQVADIEKSLFSMFMKILEADVVEFMPYVFQILAQLLEARPDVPQCYGQLTGLLVRSELYKSKGNIPAVIRLLGVFIAKEPQKFANTALLGETMGVFQKLVMSKTLDNEGFELLNAIIQYVPYQSVKPMMPTVMQIMFTRLSGSKTMKFCKMLVLFCSIFIVKHGADELISVSETMQAGIWKMLLTNVWVPSVNKVDGSNSRKACAAALIILSGSPAMMQTYQTEWVLCVKALAGLIAGEKEGDDEGHLYDRATLDVNNLGSKYDDGYTNSFCPLACAAKPETDFCSHIPDIAAYFNEKWTAVLQLPQFPQMSAMLRTVLPPNHLAFLKLA